MIRMVQSVSADQAKAYYADALLKTDYYLEDQELSGGFQGKLAARLGISGSASKEQFFALCENRNPVTNMPLTPRTKQHRTTGYDINFHCPKSVSVVHVLSKDDHIVEAFRQSVSETMADIEADVKTRVRKGKTYSDRQSGELIYADFIHQTARPVDGFDPDPHLHAHCYVFNATWDEKENRVKAGKFKDIKKDMPYYQALFHKRLSDRLVKLGYEVRKTSKSFEIEGVPKEVIDLFSKRTDEIGRIAKEQGITEAKALSELGARTRAKKQKGTTMTELKAEWRIQILELTPEHEKGSDGILRNNPNRKQKYLSPEYCIDHTLKHDFERASVVSERRLLTTAIRHSVASDIDIRSIMDALKNDQRIIKVKDGEEFLCTTKEVLQEEKRMVALARKGVGRYRPLYSKAPETKLGGQQGEAIRHVLTTPNQVSIIRGAAGAGKTKLMQEAVPLIHAANKKVTIVAPTADASRGVLRDEGFAQATTVAAFLGSSKMQKDLAGQVLWVDEAGLLGTKDMADLLDVADQQGARVILGGDTRQHASVVRGDALRILNKVAGIKTAEVSLIYRQLNKEYKEAVSSLAEGDVKSGFNKLDEIGFIKSIDPMKPNKVLVDDYMQALRKGKSGLVISPTHKQAQEVTNEIRERLKKERRIGKKEIKAESLIGLNFTEAEKADWRNYQKGQEILFSQNLKGIQRGSRWIVNEASESGIQLQNKEGLKMVLPLKKEQYFDVFDKTEITLSKGDKVRITRTSFDKADRRMDNGKTFDVLSVTKGGEIKLRNPISKEIYLLGNDEGNIAHAHCITSYASQGKTVDEVFITQPGSTFGATDAKQFYVSVSRGREKATVYTDDKETLLEHAQKIGDRQSAIELVQNRDKQLQHAINRTRQRELKKTRAQEKQPTISKNNKTDRDYEPGL